MKKTRHTTDQIIEKLRQADIALGKGQQVPEIGKIFSSKSTGWVRADSVTGVGVGVSAVTCWPPIGSKDERNTSHANVH